MDFIIKNAPISILVFIKSEYQFKVVQNDFFIRQFGLNDDEIISSIKTPLSPYIERAFLNINNDIQTVLNFKGNIYNVSLLAVDTEQVIVYIYGQQNHNYDLLMRHFNFLVDDFVFIVSEDGVFLDVLTAKENQLFLQKNETINRSIKDVFDLEMAKKIDEKLKEAKKHKVSTDFNYSSPNGKNKFNARIVYDDEALPPRFIIKSVDITEDLKKMESYKQLNQHYQEMSMITKTYLWEVDQNAVFTYLDETYEHILGYQRKDIIGKKKYFDFMDLSVKQQYINTIEEIFNNKVPVQEFENIKITRNGKKVHLLSSGIPILDIQGELIGYRGIDRDVTEHYQINESMQKTEFLNQILFKHTPVGLAWFDINGNVTATNEYLYKIFGDNIKRIIDHCLFEIEDHYLRELVKDTLKGFKGYYENKYENHTGETIHYRAIFIPLQDQFENIFGGICIVENLTEYYENKLEYEKIKTVDRLTKTFRRTYFHELIHDEKNISRAYGIIICDINGLKYLNEAFGLDFGDRVIREVARIIKDTVKTKGDVFRVGGDSFIILLNSEEISHMNQEVNQIKQNVNHIKFEQVQISISIGYAVKEKNKCFEPVISKAEEILSKNKILDGTSVNVETINLMMNTLDEKSSKFMQHSKRVSLWAEKLAKASNLLDNEVKQIKIAALLHDIGKVNADAYLLNKTEPLTQNEITILKKHPEVGHRILQAVERYDEIAQIVLEHHERYDGNGYPFGIKGKEISIGARILAIADSFDAMLDTRPYRKQFCRDEAIAELICNKNTQFDPELVDIFLQKVLKANQKS